jgi:signal transduction histidine kinase/DNA-binding LacI/PurR family transcriptional regulator
MRWRRCWPRRKRGLLSVRGLHFTGTIYWKSGARVSIIGMGGVFASACRVLACAVRAGGMAALFPLKGSMKRIALLLDYLYIATYQQEVLEGLVSALPPGDTELYVFLGGHFYRDLYDRFVTSRNKIYELITKSMFEGIIVCSSVVNRLTADEIRRAMTGFPGIPVVFIGNGPDEFHRVVADNRQGMEGVVHHIIEDHGRTRIAFVKGKADNKEASERYAAYQSQLEAAGLPFDPELVCDGGFNLGDGIEAVRIFIDERRTKFDALIASNDAAALGAKMELERRGLSVAKDVALAGFDDSLDAMCVIPSLTTVRQPYAAIGARVFAVLEELGRGGSPPKVNVVPTEPVIRQSCGCFVNRGEDENLVYAGPSAEPAGVFYASHRAEYVRQLADCLSPFVLEADAGAIEPLMDVVFALVTGQGVTDPTVLIQKIVSFSIIHNLKIEIWQDALTLVRNLLSPLFTTREIIERAENFFHRARLAISDIQSIQNNQNLIMSWKQTDQVSEVSQTLFSTVESTGLRDEIYRTFPVFNIKNFLFAEYASAKPTAEGAKLIALIRDGRAEAIEGDVYFPPPSLFPALMTGFSSRVCLVLPVVYQENSLGFVMYGKIEREGPLYSNLSGELEGSFYYEKTKGLPPLYMSLTTELSKSFYINRLINLRNAAEATLQRLAENLEFRNRELEDFTHIASHDLKEPLRKIAFFSDRLQHTVAERLSSEERDYLERMQNAALRMGDLIEGLLAYTHVSTTNRPITSVNLASVVSDVLVDLEILLQETQGTVKAGVLPSIQADPLLMRELFQNLIQNALKYHRPDVPPVVVIASAAAGEFVEISVTDNGIGFEQKYEDKIFGLFQRLVGKSTHEGTGIGLTICKKIVEKHRGTIRAFSDLGQGAKFVVRLPAGSAQ